MGVVTICSVEGGPPTVSAVLVVIRGGFFPFDVLINGSDSLIDDADVFRFVDVRCSCGGGGRGGGGRGGGTLNGPV